MRRLRIGIIGAGRRIRDTHLPVLKALESHFEIVGVWSRSRSSREALAKEIGVKAFPNIESLVSDARIDAALVSVSYQANGEIAIETSSFGIPMFLETPFAPNLVQAKELFDQIEKTQGLVEVGEQNPFKPQVEIIELLLDSGVVGELQVAQSDLLSQGYHGISVARRHIGFDLQPLHLTSSQIPIRLAPYTDRFSGSPGETEEILQTAAIQFESQRSATFQWTTLGWHTPARWWKGFRVLTDRGMLMVHSINEEEPEFRIQVQQEGFNRARSIIIDRKLKNGVLRSLSARWETDDSENPIVEWRNPIFEFQASAYDGKEWSDDFIGVARLWLGLYDAVNEGKPLLYGHQQGMMDLRLHLAIAGENPEFSG